jgi:hypothetical protein
MMLGLPGETMADIDELGRFALELAAIAPKLVLGIAPFVAKRNTPLDRQPFAPVADIEARLACCARGGGPGRAAPHLTQVGLGRVPPGPGRLRRRPAAARPPRAGGRFGDWKAAWPRSRCPTRAPPPPGRSAPPADPDRWQLPPRL